MRFGSIIKIVLAHTATDVNQGAIPVLLPFFIAEHHITYAAAATMVFATNIVSTIAQPVFGYVADRQSRPWLKRKHYLSGGVEKNPERRSRCPIRSAVPERRI